MGVYTMTGTGPSAKAVLRVWVPPEIYSIEALSYPAKRFYTCALWFADHYGNFDATIIDFPDALGREPRLVARDLKELVDRGFLRRSQDKATRYQFIHWPGRERGARCNSQVA
jgi:hypothetical protein